MISGETRFALADHPNRTKADGWAARRLLAGWSPRAIAVGTGVSLRTAQRWRSEIVRVEDVEVGGYVASFAIRRTKPPLRLEPWRKLEP